MGISKYFDELNSEYTIYGLLNNEFEGFKFGNPYDGFLTQKK
jgi:hypothetical protein